MKLVLLRHATRSAFDLELDPAGESPLNAIGLRQAEDLPQHLNPRGPLPTPTTLIASPRLRARQTLQPLAKKLGLKLTIEEGLDERHSGESVQAFNARVLSVFEKFCKTQTHSGHPTQTETEEVLYLCTHFDWLEAAALVWPTNFSERETSSTFSPLEYQVFELQNGILHTVFRSQVHPAHGVKS